MRSRDADLPILGEPLIAEFANTLYIDETTRLDVLERPSWTAAWFRRAPCAADLAHPGRLSPQDAARLRALRDAVRGLLERRHDRRAAEIELINTTAGSRMSRRLASSAAGELEVVTGIGPRGIDGVLEAIALRVIDAVENGTFDLHRVCDRSGCNLYYFRDHHRRRYCNVRCANADRQARYNARRAEPSRRNEQTNGGAER